MEVDVYPAYDWQDEGGFDAFYEELLRQRTSENLSWFCPAAAERQKLFVQEQSPQVSQLLASQSVLLHLTAYLFFYHEKAIKAL